MRARLSMIAFLVFVATSLGASELWIHVRVTERGSNPTKVEINVPLRLIERLAPHIDEYQRHDAELRIGHERYDVEELREKWRQLERGETLVEDDAVLKLSEGPQGRRLAISERNGFGGAELTMPAEVVEALLSGPRDRLDLQAAVRALAQHGEGELVTARDDGSVVRIWIDTDPESGY